MSYKIDVKVLRDRLKELGYKEMPNVLDTDTEDISTAYMNMGYSLIFYSIDGETVSGGSLVGTRFYRLVVTYKAQTAREYDNVCDKFEVLHSAFHKLAREITDNEIVKKEDNQFIYLGKLEFGYGDKQC